MFAIRITNFKIIINDNLIVSHSTVNFACLSLTTSKQISLNCASFDRQSNLIILKSFRSYVHWKTHYLIWLIFAFLSVSTAVASLVALKFLKLSLLLLSNNNSFNVTRATFNQLAFKAVPPCLSVCMSVLKQYKKISIFPLFFQQIGLINMKAAWMHSRAISAIYQLA